MRLGCFAGGVWSFSHSDKSNIVGQFILSGEQTASKVLL